MATISLPRSSRWHYIGVLYFDASVDPNASVFYPDGKAITEANAGILDANGLAIYDALMLVADEASFTGTITVAVLKDPADDYTQDASWATLQSPPGTDVALAADKAIILDAPIPAPALRLESSGNEAADRSIRLYGRVEGR